MPKLTDLVELLVEKPAAGGRMLARLEGQVVLVSGAIPGERVRARIQRDQRGVLYASTEHVIEAHASRREVLCDPACGGMAYAYIALEHQRALKAQIIADAFARIGKISLPGPVEVAASPERGYRMRARVHLRDGRLGSFREGTHEVCDYTATGQLSEPTNDVLRQAADRFASHAASHLDAIEVAENMAGDERVLHLETGGIELEGAVLASLASIPGVTGLSTASGPSARICAVAGRAWVADRLGAFVPALDPRSSALPLRRHARSFFQANRFLTSALVQAVLSRVVPGPLIDLYAGVGLFAVCAAAGGRSPVIAVEGDRTSSADLRNNASPFRGQLVVEASAVEEFFIHGRHQARASTLIVDPPRTGMSREAMQGVLAHGAQRLIYVSCDVATLARDAGRLVGAGYQLGRVEAFDLFPNTPHVETMVVFDRSE